MVEYHKLVRDRIPEIIKAEGRSCQIRVLSEDEYHSALVDKLGEELKEYSINRDVSELADLAEVLLALVQVHGMTPGSFERVRLIKWEERGGFDDRLFLLTVE